MEVLKFSLITFIYFYFSWFQFLIFLIFIKLFYYYINNKNILLEKINYYILNVYKKFKNNYIGKYIHKYLELVNAKYLQLRNYLINKLFNIIIQIGIIIMFEKEEKQIPIIQKKNKKSNKPFDFNKFLYDLE
jgi:hypothetical protein